MSASAGRRGRAPVDTAQVAPKKSTGKRSREPVNAASTKKPKSETGESAAVVGIGWFDRYVGVNDEYRQYMREEWGFEKRGDQPLFEKLCLEGAQAGLSWATILKKREAYRRAFKGFDIAACASLTEVDVERLLKACAPPQCTHRTARPARTARTARIARTACMREAAVG